MTDNTAFKELKSLVLDNEFADIQAKAKNEVNLMELLGVAHKELQHSNILAWLFDPKESHGLGDYFLKEFIKLYYKENDYDNLGSDASGITVFDFIRLNFDDLIIKREDRNVDIILLSYSNRLVIAIENKVHTSEHSNQLGKYKDQIEEDYKDFNHKVYIYLTLFPQEPSDDDYTAISYDLISNVINNIIESDAQSINKNIRFVLSQYLTTIKSLMGDNKDLENLSIELYKRYKNAFDTVFKYAKPGVSNTIPHNLHDLIEKSNALRPFPSNKYYVRFQPQFLYDDIVELKRRGFVDEDDDMTNNWMFYFEFNVTPYYIYFNFKIGEHHKTELRETLFNHLVSNEKIFDKVKKRNGKLRGKWHQAYQKKIITKRELERSIKEDEFDLDELIERRFNELIQRDLPKIRKGLVES